MLFIVVNIYIYITQNLCNVKLLAKDTVPSLVCYLSPVHTL